jgi:hypothetical protein
MIDISKLVHEARATASIDGRYVELGEGDEDEMPEAVLTVAADGRVVLAKDITDWLEARRPRPLVRRGTAKLTELDSFIAHVKRHRGEESVIFAETKTFTLVAIYDYHEEGPPTPYETRSSVSPEDSGELAKAVDAMVAKGEAAGVKMSVSRIGTVEAGRPAWMRHRAEYTCPRSRQWMTWTGVDGVAMNQTQFGDFLENNLDDVTSEQGYEPPAQLVTMARNLQVYTQGVFERKIDPTNGTGTLVCKEEHGASSTRIPPKFALSIPVFDRGELYLIEARLRFAMVSGRPQFTIHLHNRARVEEDAFDGIRRRVATETDLPLFAGNPE